MARRRRFTDGAGYTRHCWECVHATDWTGMHTIDGWDAICDVDGRTVHKFSSPNNPCSPCGTRCRYETEES